MEFISQPTSAHPSASALTHSEDSRLLDLRAEPSSVHSNKSKMQCSPQERANNEHDCKCTHRSCPNA
jgi:hypothetical protein